MKSRSSLVTGGAGFIGSHLSERLTKLGWEVTILDNLTSSSRANLAASMKLLIGDCTNPLDVKKAVEKVEVVFHLAANPEVRLELSDAGTCFRQNIYATHVLLEAIKNSQAHSVVFLSTSTVYGEAKKIPTPEDYSPLEPISIYGASKLASEALISSYCHMYGKKAVILRLANIVGPRSHHGVLHDFAAKLRRNPGELEVLGDGQQTKSYLYIDDCIEGILKAYQVREKPIEVFNLGSEDQIEVTRIAKILIREKRLKEVKLRFTAGADGGRGWKGDVKKMLLDTSKLTSRGWRPRHSSEEAIRLTIKSLSNSAGERES
jgi:UDP-glucose 4-epimerase